MKHILFLYNPVAGKKKICGELDRVVSFYNQNGCLVTLCQTGMVDSVLPDFREYDLVICCGGDGTLNKIVNHMKNQNMDNKLAYIPAGSTNDYSKNIGLVGDLQEALKHTLADQVMNLDLGNFNGRHFLYVAAFGLFTKVSYETSQKIKNRFGYLAYVLGAIKSLSEIKSYKIKIQTQDQTYTGEFILGMITNSFNVAGINGIYTTDNVELNDGLFEGIFIRKPANILEMNRIITSLANKSFLEDEAVVYIKVSQVKISSDEKLDWTLDGEFGGAKKRANITVEKDGLHLVI